MSMEVDRGYARHMARRPDRDMTAVAVTLDGPDERVGGGPLGGGLLLRGRFTAKIEDPAVPYNVTMAIVAFEGRLVCDAVTVARKGNGPIVTGTTLRSTVLDSYLSRVRETLGLFDGGFLVLKERERTPTSVSYSGVRSDEWATFESTQGRDRPIEVAEVANLYREALGSPDSKINRAPTAAVARRLGVHRGHAARLVSRARQEGLLGPARAGRAGEIEAGDGTHEG